jgi:isochorismate hydrolase
MKKHAYFTAKNIKTESNKFLTKINPLRDKHNSQFTSKNSALLIIDMQMLFLNHTAKSFIPSMPAIVANIKKLQTFYLQNNLLVLQTKHINTDSNNRLMAKWWQSIIEHHNSESDIIPDLVDNNVSVLHKSQYDAFLYTDLDEQLKNHGINQIVITGVMANLCCESTARSAFMRGFEVFFTIDGTAANNKNFHMASLLNLSYGFATPVLTTEILEWGNVKQ